MDELSTALYCDAHNRMNTRSAEQHEIDNAYTTLQNMLNMLKEASLEDCSIDLRSKNVSKKIMKRYGIQYESKFIPIWMAIEKICNGEYVLKQNKNVQSESGRESNT